MALTRVSSIRTMPTKYAFVNYTDMDSMHDTSTYTQIRKHAMRQVGAAKRRPQGRNRTIELFWVPSASDTAKLTHEDQSGDDSEPRASKTVTRKRRVADDRALYYAFIRSISSKIDPFDTASVTLDSSAHELLQYFTFYASRYPNTWTYSSSPLLPSTPAEHKHAINQTVRAALHNVLLGHCLLATAASRICYTNGVVRPRIQEKELSLTQTALQLLRTRLGASTDTDRDGLETLIACMLHLGSAAFYKGDISTAALHIKATTTLAERIGGIDAINDPYVRGRIISFDDLISCLELRPCLLDDTYDPPFQMLLSSEDAFAQQTPAIAACDLLVMNSHAMPQSLRELVLQIVQYQHMRLQSTQSESTSTFDALANRQRLTLRLLAIRNRLLALQLIDPQANILRVALLMWTLLPSSDMSQATIVNALAPKLKYGLKNIRLLDWALGKDTYVWCLLMGYCCSKEGSQVEVWFATQMRWQLMNKQMRTSDKAELFEMLVDLQRGHMYHQAIQEAKTERLAG